MAAEDETTTQSDQRALADALLGGGLSRRELLDAPPRIDRYELGERIGEGATSEVFRARDTELDRVVAIKLLRGLHEDPIRFKREMEILGALQHPNIVRIYDGGTLGGRPYYAMELIQGRPLHQAGLSRAAAVEAVEQAALACHAAHQQDVVHRDLKPANILVAADGRAVVADFGVAKVLGSTRTHHTAPGSILGTPRYMAPEQWDGESVDARADVYALGVILFELLAGAPPFTGATMSELGAQAVNKPPPRLRDLDPTIPERLERIVQTALAKRPDARQASALVLAKQLAAWRRGDPPDAETLIAPAVAAAGSRPPLLAAATGLLLLGLLTAGLALGARRPPAPDLTDTPDTGTETTAPPPLPAPSASTAPAPRTVVADPLPSFLEPIDAALRDWQRAPLDLRRGLDRSPLQRIRRGLGATLSTRKMSDLDRRRTQFVWAHLLRLLDGDPVDALDAALVVRTPQEAGRAHLLRAWARFEPWFLRECSGVPVVERDDDDEPDDVGERALADLREALKLGLERPWRRHVAATLFDALRGEHEQAEAGFARLVAARPHLPAGELDLLQGQLALLRGAPEQALVHLLRAAALQGTALRARRALAPALLERDRPAEAFVALVEALTLEPETSRRTLPTYARFLQGVRQRDLAPDLPRSELSDVIRRLEARRAQQHETLPLLQALGSSRVVRALQRSPVDPADLRAGIRILRDALSQAPRDPLTLLSLSYANALGAQHLRPAAPYRRAAWTGLQRLQRLGEGVADDDAVEALAERLEREIPRPRPGDGD